MERFAVQFTTQNHMEAIRKRMEGAGLNAEEGEDILTYLGRRITWEGLETNGLLWELWKTKKVSQHYAEDRLSIVRLKFGVENARLGPNEGLKKNTPRHVELGIQQRNQRLQSMVHELDGYSRSNFQRNKGY